MSLRSKRKIEVDSGELESERESLCNSLCLKLKGEITLRDHTITVESDISRKELKRLVSKFIHRQNLANTYWVSSEKGVIKIHKSRPLKRKEHDKRGTPPSIIKHGW